MDASDNSNRDYGNTLDLVNDPQPDPYDAKIDDVQRKRRERNKFLARKSRQKMKEDLELLKKKLGLLKEENESLKSQLNSISTPGIQATELLKYDVQLPDSISNIIKELIKRTEKTISPRKLKRSSFCVANAISVDYPIVYASPGFSKLTGYPINEIVGRNCRFLQGPKTDQNEVSC